MSQTPALTMDEALAIIEADPSWAGNVLQVIEEERHLDIYSQVLLEFEHRGSRGFIRNLVAREYDRLKSRKDQRDEARKKILSDFHSKKGAS